MMTATDELDPSDGVVVTEGSDSFHRSHPSMLIHLACNPDVKGELRRIEEVDDDRSPCQHVSCFGGDDA